jgi:hypothetical protein
VDWIHGGKVWVKELGGMNTIAKFDFHNWREIFERLSDYQLF